MSILRARRPAILPKRSPRHFPFLSRAIETRPWTFSIRSVLIARSPVTRASIVAFMPGVAFGRRGLVHPGRQHFQVD
jgi:hypothetical protein